MVFSGGERIGVDAMDNKAKIEESLRALPLPGKLVVLHTAFFYENVATKRGTRRVRVRACVRACVRARASVGRLVVGSSECRWIQFVRWIDTPSNSLCSLPAGGGGPRLGPAPRLPLLHPPPPVRRMMLDMANRAAGWGRTK